MALRIRPSALLAALAVLAASLVGCAGDPQLESAVAPATLTVDRTLCEVAPPGCEGVRGDGLTLASCRGEPLLGALVDAAGGVRCVDALSLLQVEIGPRSSTSLAAGDPSPQPNRPPPPALR